MGLLRFQAANCKNCYRCIRTCPVKAIEFKDNQAQIITDDCILCCSCIKECPQNAKTVDSDVYKVVRMLRAGGPVIVSLAPSFAGYTEDPLAYIDRLRQIGFAEIRETAEAAVAISSVYEQEFRAKGKLITTACPVIVEYIEKYMPEWLGLMAESDSPMMAHAKWIKRHVPDAKVVFIGPCYAKKSEAVAQPGFVDAVLTFEEAEQLPMGMAPHTEVAAAAESPARSADPNLETARLYPVEGGILETTFPADNEPASSRHRAVSGIENCRRLLSSMKDLPDGYFLELNACEGGCLNGPASGDQVHPLLKQDRLLAFRQNKMPPVTPLPMNDRSMIRRTFKNKSKPKAMYSNEQVRAVLKKIGKHYLEDELNCGACGYNTCRDKAEAVLAGKAELYMCMPYAQAKAESFAHVLLEKTPNAVIAVTDQLLVKEVNDAACSFFQMDEGQLHGLPLPFLLPMEEFPLPQEEQVKRKLYFSDLRKTANVTASYVPEHQLYLVILHDLTEQEQEQERLRSLKHETVEMAQRVIENQMRVAQEIAGLLGETTAETKVTLTKMKRLLLE